MSEAEWREVFRPQGWCCRGEIRARGKRTSGGTCLVLLINSCRSKI